MAAGVWTSGTSGLGDANQALTTLAIRTAMTEAGKNKALIGCPVLQAILAQDQGLKQLMAARGVQISYAQIGTGVAAATAEGTAATPTDWSTTNKTVTPARRAFARKQSDYGVALSSPVMTPSAYAQIVADGFGVWQNTVVSLLTALAGSASHQAGVSGAPLTWSTLFNMSIDFRNRGSEGAVACVIDAAGLKQLAADVLSMGGAVANAAQVQQFLNGSGGAFVGVFFGNLWLYISSALTSDGGDTLGMAFDARGIITKHERVAFQSGARVLVHAGWYRGELLRPGGGVEVVEWDMYNGAGVGDAAGLQRIRYAA